MGRVWLPLTYFALWITRLMGWLPDLTRCLVCNEPFAGGPAYFHAQTDGLFCGLHKRMGASTLSPESQALAAAMLRAPVAALAQQDWPRARALDLRRFLIQALERHLERRLTSAVALAKLGG